MTPWLETARAQQERAKTLVAGLTDTQLNWHPDPQTWSLGQQLDHLATVLEKAVAEMEKAQELGSPPGKATDWKPTFLERKFIQMVGARPNGRTNPVPKGFEPTEAALSVSGTLTRFLAAQEGLIQRIQENQHTDLGRVKVASAVLPILKLSLGAWFAAMENHTTYHLDKAAALRDRLPAP